MSRRGRVHRRGNGWAFTVDTGHEGGKRKQVMRGGFATKKVAQEALNEVLTDVQRGDYVPRQHWSLREYLETWMNALEAQGRRPTTIESYERHLRLHVLSRPIADYPLHSITAIELDELYVYLLREGRADGTGGLSRRTVRFVHGILSKALSDAVKKRLIPWNPATAADAPTASSARSPEPTTWTGDQLATFLRQRKDDRHAALWRVLAMTGVRRGEVLGIRWQDIDFITSTLHIRQSVLPIKNQATIDSLKSDRSRRSITLDSGTVEALKAHKARQAQERLLLGSDYQDHDLVFPLPDGRPYYPPRLGDAFTWRVKKSGLPRIRMHDLRHTHATLLLAQGTDVKTVSERLGHASVQFTLDTYVHPKTSTHSVASQRFADLIDGATDDAVNGP